VPMVGQISAVINASYIWIYLISVGMRRMLSETSVAALLVSQAAVVRQNRTQKPERLEWYHWTLRRKCN
jgi:hypothetical protein